MIRLSTFMPEYFNNNGDQGNLEVLSYCLNDSGSKAQIDSNPTRESDFVLVGDASFAAIRRFSNELNGLLGDLEYRLDSGLPTLLVGSSYEHLAPLLGIQLETSDRVSAFVEEHSSAGSIFGYQNSVVSKGRFFQEGLFFGTTLFGPLLAKNPTLLTQVLEALAPEAKLQDWQLNYPREIRDRTTFG